MSTRQDSIHSHKFVHLRLHSTYSLGSSSLKIGDIFSLAQQHHTPAVAITDSNNMFGVKVFSDNACKAGIKPILGMEAMLALPEEVIGTINTGKGLKNQCKSAPIVLLAKDAIGYANLLKLHKLL